MMQKELQTELTQTRETRILLLVLLATTFPFWLPDLLPAADLPQHLAQLHLLEQTLSGLRSEFEATPWFYPNALVYWLLYGFWQLVDPVTVGKFAMSGLAGLWILSGWALCRNRQRPFENWLVSVPLTFNFLFNWGLLNFLIGWPIFCLFMMIGTATETRFRGVLLFIVAILLYQAHALWFVMANTWFATHLLDQGKLIRWREWLPLFPVWLLALIWYPILSEKRASSGVETGLDWGAMPHRRIESDYLTDAALGSMHVPLEPAYLFIVCLWIALALWTHRNDIGERVDKPLLIAALMLLLAYWILPSIYMNTIFFNQRWLPCALVLLLLSLPAPRLPRMYLRTLGLGLVVAFSLTAAKFYKEWEAEQLDGFQAAIGQITPEDRVLGLNLNDHSTLMKGRPSLQLFAYAQALRGADIHFSFTEHHSGAVQFRTRPELNPERHLVWNPAKVRPANLAGFNVVLLHADDDEHTLFRKKLGLPAPESSARPWRIYRLHPQRQ